MDIEINTPENVKSYFKTLVEELSLSFHPDDNFADYVINGTKKPLFTEEEAKKHNALMSKCFEVCEKNKVDIYQIGLNMLRKKQFKQRNN
jgi:hypothetical protein